MGTNQVKIWGHLTFVIFFLCVNMGGLYFLCFLFVCCFWVTRSSLEDRAISSNFDTRWKNRLWSKPESRRLGVEIKGRVNPWIQFSSKTKHSIQGRWPRPGGAGRYLFSQNGSVSDAIFTDSRRFVVSLSPLSSHSSWNGHALLSLDFARLFDCLQTGTHFWLNVIAPSLSGGRFQQPFDRS